INTTKSLTKDNPRFENRYFESFPYHFERGTIYQIDVKSTDFDAFLYLKEGDGAEAKTIGWDDDGGEGLNARYFFRPEKSGDYNVWATTFRPNTTGNYTLQIRQIRLDP